ncbi:MAG: Wzt carbohydrate-binding domain-containing protein, partial [Chthoniobacterales bacterium]
VLRDGEMAFLGDATAAVKQFNNLLKGARKPADAVALPERNRTGEAVVDEKEILWPDDQAFYQIKESDQILSEIARCTRAALCDNDLQPCNVFHQGEKGRLFFEFQFLADVVWPVCGFCIRNNAGLMIHGRLLIQADEVKLAEVGLAGSYLRCGCEISLDLSCGEYTIDFGLSSMPDYQKLGRDRSISLDAFNEIHQRISDTHAVLTFAIVLPKTYTGLQLTHYGLVDLPGKMEYEITKRS